MNEQQTKKILSFIKREKTKKDKYIKGQMHRLKRRVVAENKRSYLRLGICPFCKQKLPDGFEEKKEQ